ncbi:MAG: DUF47 domain-containing protein [Thermoleophilia bacterium]|nr:DUF47 domain-containing protein [Thermoleophilia bacterium]
MRLALVPKPSEFYDLFARAGENGLAAARLTEERFRDHPNTTVAHSEVKRLETVGDELTHEIIQLLNTHYVTPFDREDIYALATAMDDVVDAIEHASELLDLYAVESTSRSAIEQCRILVTAAEHLALALRELKGRKHAQAALVEIKRFEDDADRVVRDAIGALFHDPRIDPLLVIRWKDIYEALEEAVDGCETAGNVVGNIVVKNA